jgi:hypothetical protein
MLQVFYLDVAYVAVPIHICCKVYCKCFIYFGRMLHQMLYVARVSSAGAARGSRQRWSPRAHGPHVRVGSQASATAGAEHKAGSMGVAADVKYKAASMLGCSLIIPAGCGRSAAASRASSSMRAVGVRDQAWPITAAPDGSGRDDSLTSVHGQIGTQWQRHVGRSTRGKAGHGAGSWCRASGHIVGAVRRTHCWRRKSGCWTSRIAKLATENTGIE